VQLTKKMVKTYNEFVIITGNQNYVLKLQSLHATAYFFDLILMQLLPYANLHIQTLAFQQF